VRRGVSKGATGHRLPALRVGHPRNGLKAVSGVARPQGIEGSGIAGPGETLRSPCTPLAIRACSSPTLSPHPFSLTTRQFVGVVVDDDFFDFHFLHDVFFLLNSCCFFVRFNFLLDSTMRRIIESSNHQLNHQANHQTSVPSGTFCVTFYGRRSAAHRAFG
jgi:hypothetical protein